MKRRRMPRRRKSRRLRRLVNHQLIVAVAVAVAHQTVPTVKKMKK